MRGGRRTPEDALAALGAASEAQAGWKGRQQRERGEILRRAFGKIVRRTDELALLMILEMGKGLLEPGWYKVVRSGHPCFPKLPETP